MQSVRETGRFEAKFWVRGKEGRRFLAHVRQAITSDKHAPRIGLTGASIEASLDGTEFTGSGRCDGAHPARPLVPAAPYGRAIDHLDEAKKR